MSLTALVPAESDRMPGSSASPPRGSGTEGGATTLGRVSAHGRIESAHVRRIDFRQAAQPQAITTVVGRQIIALDTLGAIRRAGRGEGGADAEGKKGAEPATARDR